MTDLRQTKNWADYLSTLGWKYEQVENAFIYIKSLPFGSLIKIQRAKNLTEEALKKIDKIAFRDKALFVKIEPDANGYSDTLTKCGYEKSYFPLTSPNTIIIDLTKPETYLWGDLKKDARQAVKRARSSNLTTEFFKNPPENILKTYHKFVEKAGRERKFFIPSFSDLSSKIKAFGDKSEVAITSSGKESLCACLILKSDDTAFYMESGTTKHGRKLFANYKQIWDLLLHLKASGVKNLNLEGIYDERFPNFTAGWMGFTFFKKKFGGNTTELPGPYIKYFSEPLKLLRKVFRSPLPL